MFVDFIIAFCSIGLLICAFYIIYQVKKLKYEKTHTDFRFEDEPHESEDVFASIEDETC